MDPFGRLEELIEGVAECAFTRQIGPPELLRAAWRGLLRDRRAWFGTDLAPNRIELHVDPAAHAEWTDVQAALEQEIARRLEIFAQEHGIELTGPIAVALVGDDAQKSGVISVRTAVTEPASQPLFDGPLVTPLGWTFTGRRMLRRLVLREDGADGGREHLVVFASRLVVGPDTDCDLCPPAEYRTTPAVLAAAGRFFVARPCGWERKLGLRGRYREVLDGDRLRFARGCVGDVRLAVREGQMRSVVIVSKRWTVTLAPGEVIIGRVGAVTDLLLGDAATSACHARLVATSEGIEIQDLASANGVVINSRRVDRAAPRPGDVVTLGRTDLSVVG